MTTKYEFEGETFQLDDSKGCYIEVTYGALTGYIGVNLKGTADSPYVWWANNSNPVTDDGLRFGNSNGPDEKSNLEWLCRDLLRRQQEAQAQKAFNQEAACKSLHEFVKSLPE